MPPKENPTLGIVKSIQYLIKEVELKIEKIIDGALPKDFLLKEDKDAITKNGVIINKNACITLFKIYQKLKNDHFIVKDGEFLSSIDAENIKMLFIDNGFTQNKTVLEQLKSITATNKEYFLKIAQKWDIKQVHTLNEVSEIFSTEDQFKFEQNYNFKDKMNNNDNTFKEIWASLQIYLINFIHLLKDIDIDLINKNDINSKIENLIYIKNELKTFIIKHGDIQSFLEKVGYSGKDNEFNSSMIGFFSLINDDIKKTIPNDFENYKKLLDKFKVFYRQIKYIQKNICNEIQK